MSFVRSVPFQVWANNDLILYHRTAAEDAASILDKGVNLERSRPNKDFGNGFYTTTNSRQASEFAERRFNTRNAIVQFKISRLALADLTSLVFVRGALDAEGYWSFVHHCRSGRNWHIPQTEQKYDVVYGPVARIWRLPGKIFCLAGF